MNKCSVDYSLKIEERGVLMVDISEHVDLSPLRYLQTFMKQFNRLVLQLRHSEAPVNTELDFETLSHK